MLTSVTRAPAGTHLSLEGDLCEDFDFAPLLPQLEGPVVIDLQGIRRINSAGVRQWIRFLGAISGSADVTLARCPAAFVHQAALIRNFLQRARVTSFYAPYICPGCEASRSVLVEVATIAGRSPPPVQCGPCSTPMTIDAVPEVFFGFLEA
jgi:hypothetical protein